MFQTTNQKPSGCLMGFYLWCFSGLHLESGFGWFCWKPLALEALESTNTVITSLEGTDSDSVVDVVDYFYYNNTIVAQKDRNVIRHVFCRIYNAAFFVTT